MTTKISVAFAAKPAYVYRYENPDRTPSTRLAVVPRYEPDGRCCDDYDREQGNSTQQTRTATTVDVRPHPCGPEPHLVVRPAAIPQASLSTTMPGPGATPSESHARSLLGAGTVARSCDTTRRGQRLERVHRHCQFLHQYRSDTSVAHSGSDRPLAAAASSEHVRPARMRVRGTGRVSVLAAARQLVSVGSGHSMARACGPYR